MVDVDLQKWEYHLRSLLGCEICEEQIIEAKYQMKDNDSSTIYDFIYDRFRLNSILNSDSNTFENPSKEGSGPLENH